MTENAWRLVLLLLVSAWCCGCAQGPRDLSRMRAPYNQAIQSTSAEQMLQNLVRLKYRESPEFLAVTAIASQSTYNGGGSVGVSLPEAALSMLTLGASASYSERPTFTFQSRDDPEFQRGLLEPIPLSTIALVTQTGWATDRVQRLTIKNINGVDNATSAGGPTPADKPEFEKFQRAAYLMRELQQKRWVELATVKSEELLIKKQDTNFLGIPWEQVSTEEIALLKDRGYSVRPVAEHPELAEFYRTTGDLSLRFHPLAWTTPEAVELARLLEVKPFQDAYVVKNSTSEEGQLGRIILRRDGDYRTEMQLLVTPRSVLEMMYYLAQAVPAPPEHLNANWMTTTRDVTGAVFDWNQLTAGLFQVHVCADCPPPDVASVAVPYKGYWYYIANNDLTSKATFSLLQEIYNIEVRGGDKGIPFIIGS
ncbi:MAG: hypothetical protein MPJ50_01805 [Pirellulales bacterium]|nr:hypothetical protein [Pirellulales bacterium]